MKTTRLILIASVFVCMIDLTYAQESPNTQMLLIHEDNVIVSKTSQYVKTSEGLVKLLVDNNFKEMTYTAFWVDDYTYMYVSPIDNMAQLDENPWGKLSQLAGKEKTEAVFSGFDGTYDTHRDFIAIFHPDLSYKPEQLQEEGYNYREWAYLYYNQSNQDQVMSMAEEWKKLYEDKNVTTGYTIYTNGFGHDGPVMVIHRWARNPGDLGQEGQKINEMLGDAGQKLWERTQALAYRMEVKTGWFLPNLSYMPQE